jgi:hypothetical protein
VMATGMDDGITAKAFAQRLPFFLEIRIKQEAEAESSCSKNYGDVDTHHARLNTSWMASEFQLHTVQKIKLLRSRWKSWGGKYVVTITPLRNILNGKTAATCCCIFAAVYRSVDACKLCPLLFHFFSECK